MSAAARVLVVDDDPLVRAGLSMMLHGADGIARSQRRPTPTHPTSC
jgi:hypothetical protein